MHGADFLETKLNENIYEELPKQINDIQSSTHGDYGDSYDHLDFSRPLHELKPHYLSTDTLRSQKSRSSRSPAGSDRVASPDLCQAILDSVENLSGGPGGRSRKTIGTPSPVRGEMLPGEIEF